MRVRERLQPFLHPGNLVAAGMLALIVLAALWLQARHEADIFTPDGLKSFVVGLGWRGRIVYMGILTTTVVISQLPGVPLAVAAGMIWGPLEAALYTIIGGFIGSIIDFYLGKTIGRSLVKSVTGKVVAFSEERGERYLAVVVLVTRVLPVLSFDVVSYAAGMSGLSIRYYAAATLLGMTPPTLLLTYMGSALPVGGTVALLLSSVAAVLIVILPFGIRRWNWFGLRTVVRVE